MMVAILRNTVCFCSQVASKADVLLCRYKVPHWGTVRVQRQSNTLGYHIYI